MRRSFGRSAMLGAATPYRLAVNSALGFLGEVQGNDGDVLRVDVLPDVEISPVADRKNADTFVWFEVGIAEIPGFGALCLGIPAMTG